MNKNRITAICAIAFVSILAFTLYSCENSNEEPIAEQPDKMTVEDFDYLGEWHNEFLVNAHENFSLSLADSNSEPTKEVVLKELLQLNKSFAASSKQRYNINISQKELDKKFDENYRLADREYVSEILFDNGTTRANSEDEIAGLQPMVEELKNSQIISEFSYGILQDLVSSLQDNYNKLLSDYDLKQKVLLLIQKVNNHGYGKESTEGTLVASILAISIHSLDFWENNPDMLFTEGKVATWVAMDAAGAIWGAGGAALKYAVSGNARLQDVAIGVALGAVGASTGIVGKIAKWLF